MTDYRIIRTRKRNHSLSVRMPERSNTAVIATLADYTYVSRFYNDNYIARNGDTYVAHNTLTVYPRLFKIRKRSFSVRGKVDHG